MTDQPPADHGEPREDDMGAPIAELAQLQWVAGADFERKVTSRIERRLLAGRLLDVAWSAPWMVLLELLRAPLEGLSGSRRI